MGRRKRVAYICQQNLPSVQKKEKIQENDLENDSCKKLVISIYTCYTNQFLKNIVVHSDETPQEEMSNPPTMYEIVIQ